VIRAGRKAGAKNLLLKMLRPAQWACMKSLKAVEDTRIEPIAEAARQGRARYAQARLPMSALPAPPPRSPRPLRLPAPAGAPRTTGSGSDPARPVAARCRPPFQAVGSLWPLSISRSFIFCILPVAPSGMASTKTTSSGVHHLAILPS